MSVSIGAQAPDFELCDTHGTTHSPNGNPATVLVFTCNHCPYALAWHERIMDVARDYGRHGVRVLAINSNDAQRYPRDSYEAMKQRVVSERWPLPYLYDETQNVARAYGAKTTPDVFVLDAERRVRYRGAPDSDYDDPAQNAGWLRRAIDAVLTGEDPSPAETKPIGCSIKWKA